jgi:hypothetical protein
VNTTAYTRGGWRHSALSCALLVLSACATTPEPAGFCESDGFLIDDQFEGGNFHSCTVVSDTGAALLIRPEDEPPINRSPWYAFRVSPKTEAPLDIRLEFEHGYARYWPKLSADGKRWRIASTSEARTTDDGDALELTIDADTPSVWISAQELLTNAYYEDWVRELDGNDNADVSLLGHSVLGRPLHVAQTPRRPEVVYLIGRQHPPEVTGALAMRAFVRTVLGDSELARRFRDRYSVVVVPLINPDGIALGHWRHNVNGVDLNRDWGPFTQPETQAVARLVAEIDAAGLRPALMLDFHSTRSSLFYTQLAEESSWTIDFAAEWFARFRERRPDFEFRHDARPRSGQANTKNFFFDRYRIPAFTYEIGDEEDRATILDTSPIFAEEMMRLLLDYPEAAQIANRSNPAADEGRPPPLPLPASR